MDINIYIPGKFHAVLCDVVEDMVHQPFFLGCSSVSPYHTRNLLTKGTLKGTYF